MSITSASIGQCSGCGMTWFIPATPAAKPQGMAGWSSPPSCPYCGASGATVTQTVAAPVLANISSGWGTPTGATQVTNFPGASATLVQCSETIAELLTVLKASGVLAS